MYGTLERSYGQLRRLDVVEVTGEPGICPKSSKYNCGID